MIFSADPAYNAAQLEVLARRKPEITIQDGEVQVTVGADNAEINGKKFGDTLEFHRRTARQQTLPSGEMKESVEAEEKTTLYTVPYQGKLYLFLEKDFEEFKNLKAGRIFTHLSQDHVLYQAIAATVLTLLSVWLYRRFSNRDPVKVHNELTPLGWGTFVLMSLVGFSCYCGTLEYSSMFIMGMATLATFAGCGSSNLKTRSA